MSEKKSAETLQNVLPPVPWPVPISIRHDPIVDLQILCRELNAYVENPGLYAEVNRETILNISSRLSGHIKQALLEANGGRVQLDIRATSLRAIYDHYLGYEIDQRSYCEAEDIAGMLFYSKYYNLKNMHKVVMEEVLKRAEETCGPLLEVIGELHYRYPALEVEHELLGRTRHLWHLLASDRNLRLIDHNHVATIYKSVDLRLTENAKAEGIANYVENYSLSVMDRLGFDPEMLGRKGGRETLENKDQLEDSGFSFGDPDFAELIKQREKRGEKRPAPDEKMEDHQIVQDTDVAIGAHVPPKRQKKLPIGDDRWLFKFISEKAQLKINLLSLRIFNMYLSRKNYLGDELSDSDLAIDAWYHIIAAPFFEHEKAKSVVDYFGDKWDLRYANTSFDEPTVGIKRYVQELHGGDDMKSKEEPTWFSMYKNQSDFLLRMHTLLPKKVNIYADSSEFKPGDTVGIKIQLGEDLESEHLQVPILFFATHSAQPPKFPKAYAPRKEDAGLPTYGLGYTPYFSVMVTKAEIIPSYPGITEGMKTILPYRHLLAEKLQKIAVEVKKREEGESYTFEGKIFVNGIQFAKKRFKIPKNHPAVGDKGWSSTSVGVYKLKEDRNRFAVSQRFCVRISDWRVSKPLKLVEESAL